MAIVSVRQAGLGGFTKNRKLSWTFPSTMGMVLLTPTSIAHSGTSASIGANGQVTFTAVTSLSLNGVFSATYDNYVISYDLVSVSGNTMRARFRAAGSDATGTDYTQQELNASDSVVTAARNTSETTVRLGTARSTLRNGSSIAIYGPFLAQPTATRSITVDPNASATISDAACTHSLSTSYDGITIFPNTSSVTGKLAVYGIRG